MPNEQELFQIEMPEDHSGIETETVPEMEEFEIEVPETIEFESSEPVSAEECDTTPMNAEISIEIEAVPGAPDAKPIEVKDKKDKNDLQDGKETKEAAPKDEWDWKPFHSDGHKFVAWIEQRYSQVPAHSGTTIEGHERAKNYLKRLLSEIRSAMSTDISGKLDESAVDQCVQKIQKGIEVLEDRIDKLEAARKKASSEYTSTTMEWLKKSASYGNVPGVESAFPMVKVANLQKSNGGVVATVPLFLFRLAKVLIESTISAGHDMKSVFSALTKKWNLSDREQAELQELLLVMGYPLTMIDRGYRVDEDVDLKDGQFDFQSQYPGA